MENNICVVIPMYNYGEVTRKCVDLTLKNAGVGVDIIVVDDCSKEPYVDDRVKVIRLEKNSGFTAAANAGIRECYHKYQYVHLLNNDTEPKEDFIKLLLEAFTADQNLGIACSVRETERDGKTLYLTYPIDAVSGNTAYELEEPKEAILYNAWIPLCSALIRMDVVENVGLLDRRMRNHCSDNDFCVRAGTLGYWTALVTKSIVKHHHELTTKTVGANAKEDQYILMQKVRCDFMREVLKYFPLDSTTKLFGKLSFEFAEEEK